MPKHDYPEAKQAQALKKYYINDTSMVNACEFVPAEKAGSLLETLVLLELPKRDWTVSYFSETNECDFVIQNRDRVAEAIQVCVTITEDNIRHDGFFLLSSIITPIRSTYLLQPACITFLQ